MLVAPSIEAALAAARGDALRRCTDAIAVIGGADLYAQVMDRADRLAITHVHLKPEGDTKFPTIDPLQWRERERAEYEAGADDAAAFSIVTYERTRV
jgi:dihydrofolate reductase